MAPSEHLQAKWHAEQRQLLSERTDAIELTRAAEQKQSASRQLLFAYQFGG